MSLVSSRSVPLVVLLLSVGAFAGCLGGDDAPAGDGVVEDGPSVAERLAADLALLPCEPSYTYGETSPLFQEVSHFVVDDVGHGELDVIDGTDLLVGARYGGGGFDILNVSDPYDPEHVVGFWVNESFSLDIKATTDGKTLLSGGFGAITIIDISDPYSPVIEKTVAYPTEAEATSAQAHMLHVAHIDGTDYVFAASQIAQGVLIFRLTGEPGARDLEFLTYFAPAIGGPLAAHDMLVYHDPNAGFPILWVANGFGGFIAADVSDPALPVLVSYGPQADPYQGYTHTISVTQYGDMRVAVTIAEIGAMAVKVYDVTVLMAPVLLGTWTIQDVPTSTQHNTQILGDWMWLGHYGEGVLFFNLYEEIQTLAFPAYNVGLVTRNLGSSIEPYAQYKPEAGVWESVVVNGIHWTTAGGIRGTLNGCFEAGLDTLDAYV